MHNRFIVDYSSGRAAWTLKEGMRGDLETSNLHRVLRVPGTNFSAQPTFPVSDVM